MVHSGVHSGAHFESLYIHFPFCEHKCHYCDFYSLDSKKGHDEFIQALHQEFALYRPQLTQPFKTVFLGGGTPSLLSCAEFERALEPILKAGLIGPQTEWTLEANPNSLTPEKLRLYRSLGLNRLSIGVQSLDPDILKWLGRIHSRDEALRALENAFNSGFENVSADLICGIPGQELSHLEQSLSTLLTFPLKHLSCYLLTLHDHHPEASTLPEDASQIDHLLFVHDWLSSPARTQPFHHYEISNYALPGFEAKHNLAYWKGASYLGLGPSAHSFDPQASRRWKNHSSLPKYVSDLGASKLPLDFEETLSPEQKEIEKWMLALRLSDGFPREWIKSPKQEQALNTLLTQGFLERHPTASAHFRATPRGLFMCDSLTQKLMG